MLHGNFSGVWLGRHGSALPVYVQAFGICQGAPADAHAIGGETHLIGVAGGYRFEERGVIAGAGYAPTQVATVAGFAENGSIRRAGKHQRTGGEVGGGDGGALKQQTGYAGADIDVQAVIPEQQGRNNGGAGNGCQYPTTAWAKVMFH